MKTANPIARLLARLNRWVDEATGKIPRQDALSEFDNRGPDPENYLAPDADGVWSQVEELAKDLVELPSSLQMQTCRATHYAFIRDLQHMKMSGPALRRRAVLREGVNINRQFSALSTDFPSCNLTSMLENPGESTYQDLNPTAQP
jgi:hypothetical protein